MLRSSQQDTKNAVEDILKEETEEQKIEAFWLKSETDEDI